MGSHRCLRALSLSFAEYGTARTTETAITSVPLLAPTWTSQPTSGISTCSMQHTVCVHGLAHVPLGRPVEARALEDCPGYTASHGRGTGGHCKSAHAARARTSSVPRTSFHVSSGVDLSRFVCCVVMARTSARGCRRGSAGAVARLKKVCRVLKLAATCSAELTIFNFRGAREAP